MKDPCLLCSNKKNQSDHHMLCKAMDIYKKIVFQDSAYKI